MREAALLSCSSQVLVNVSCLSVIFLHLPSNSSSFNKTLYQLVHVVLRLHILSSSSLPLLCPSPLVSRSSPPSCQTLRPTPNSPTASLPCALCNPEPIHRTVPVFQNQVCQNPAISNHQSIDHLPSAIRHSPSSVPSSTAQVLHRPTAYDLRARAPHALPAQTPRQHPHPRLVTQSVTLAPLSPSSPSWIPH